MIMQPGTESPARQRRPRADARRNRQRVLEVARAAYAAEGPSVSVHEIARRAGVGNGTVSRHFPTKEALFAAVVRHRLAQLVRCARELAATTEAGVAFFQYFAIMVRQGAEDRSFVESLRGSGVETAAAGPEYDLGGELGGLLARAQAVSAVRADVDVADVEALAVGCMARRSDSADRSARDRLVTVVCEGLRPSAHA
ncbi:helix-turn-helix domain-containing protein [Saccharomonospora sp. NPDC006951]